LVKDLVAERNAKLGIIGNILGKDVPIHDNEDNNKVIREWGTKKDIKVDYKTPGKLAHDQIMSLLDMVDFKRGIKVAGHKGFFLKGNGLLLN